MKYKYVVFDFNGTIINDVDLCLNLLNKMLLEKSLPPIDLERYKEIFTFPIIEYYKKAGFTFEGYTFEELSLDFIKDYQPSSFKCNLYDGVEDSLNRLKEKGYKLILLSASEINNLKEQISMFKIDRYFDAVLGLDNVKASSKIDIAKEYFNKNGIDPNECLFIGDSTHDFEVAKSIGGEVILLSYGHQSRNVLSKVDAPIIDSLYELEMYL